MEQNSPFQFGKIAAGKSFINREDDIQRLSRNIESGINTILISPRRWGKSSLVQKVAEKYTNNTRFKFCFIDMFNTRTEEDFYHLFVKQVIKATSTKWEEWMRDAKRFLANLTPKVSLAVDDLSDIDIQLQLGDNKMNVLEILDLPEKMARNKNIILVLCIDEFQNIENFEDALGFQQKLRAQWQKQRNVVYCLYGSKRHMLMHLFEHKSMPFYRFGDVFYLNKIPKEHFISFIVRSFSQANKKILPETAEQLVDAVQCHSYYVQQLSHILWNNSGSKVTVRDLDKSIDDLIRNNLILFEREFQNLSNAQINFLRAMKDDIRTGFSTSEVIQKYKLASSANVVRIMEALENKEIIDRFADIEFVDPVFELWLKRFLWK